MARHVDLSVVMMRLLALSILLAASSASTPASAHDVRGEVVFLDVGEHVIDAEIDVPVLQLATARHQSIAQILAEPASVLAADATRYISMRGHTAPFAMTIRSIAPKQVAGDVISFDLRFTAPAGTSARWFALRDELVLHTIITDNIYVFVRRDLQSGALGDSPTLVGAMHYQLRELEIDRTSGNWRTSLGAAFHLGLDHIREGTDHLMFLLMLLVVAPLAAATRRWQTQALSTRHALVQTARIATAFTVGHSLTLALGAVGGIALPTRLVESLIAISILLSAIHAVRPLFAGPRGRHEPLVAGAFGLVHGLAFATALAGFGFDGRSLVLALLGFNLGVEAMQLAVILVIVPSLIALARTRAYPPFRTAVASLGIVASAAWLLERAGHVTTRIPALIERGAAHGWVVVIGLAAIAIVAVTATSVRNLAITRTKEQRI